MHVSSQNATKINILNEIVIEIPSRPTTTTGLSLADSYHLVASPYSIPYHNPFRIWKYSHAYSSIFVSYANTMRAQQSNGGSRESV